MTRNLPRFVNRKQAGFLLPEGCDEYAVVENPNYVHPGFELYPLPAKKHSLDRGLLAAVMDMDGTTTTTEALCLHALETMVRRITGRLKQEEWPGLDTKKDYPHIIGNSTTRHVEYLVRTYQGAIDFDSFRSFIVQQAAWTLANSQDESRREETRSNLRAVGAEGLVEDERFRAIVLGEEDPEETPFEKFEEIARDILEPGNLESFTTQVRFAIDVYYHRYHQILRAIKLGEGALLSEEILGSRERRLIEPMPGIGVFLALVKGWLGEQAGDLAGRLVPPESGADPADERLRLRKLGMHFERRPARVGVVTSSIRYEAEIVLHEVFGILRGQVHEWPVSEERKEKLLNSFSSPERYYDAFITATDSSEIRLKPHRDLYSIALHRLGIAVEDFDRVAAFEDSESGTIAIRAAGIPLCVAVPFEETGGHSFEAASHVCPGGLPQVLLEHNLFLSEEILKEGK